MSLRPDETFQRLRSWDYGQPLSERLAAQILADAGYSDIDPIHPRGGPDGGKDAIGTKDGQLWVMAVYFPHDSKSYSETERKATSDAKGVSKNGAHGMAFVTNQELTLSEREDLRSAVGVPLDLFHLERVAHILDKPAMHRVRRQYVGIDFGDVPTGVGTLTEAQYLEAALGAASTRRMQRLRAAGVPEERRTFVESWMQAHPRHSIQVSSSTRILLISAPMGFGKTELAHEWFIHHIRQAMKSPDAPLPLWLRARDVKGSLEGEVAARLSRESLRSVGCALVLDGVDELIPAEAVRLLESAEELCGAWEKVVVVATAKPEPILKDFPSLNLDQWTVRDGRGLAEEVAGGPLPHDWWTDEVVEALRTPLLALTLGVRASARASKPSSTSALIRDMAEQSIRSARVIPSSGVTQGLMTIAAHSLTAGTGLASSSMDADLLAGVKATPLVVEADGLLSFALPVLELIYAARAIDEGEVAIQDLRTSDQLLRWRYAFALAIKPSEPVEADQRLYELVSVNPLLASWVLDEIRNTGDPNEEPVATLDLPLSREISVADPKAHLDEDSKRLFQQLRDAYLVWVDALGAAGRSAARLRGTSVPGWTVGARESDILLAQKSEPDGVDLQGDAMPANLFRLPQHLIPGHRKVRRSHRPVGVLSRWRWARDELREGLESDLKKFRLECDPTGPIAAERAWHLSQLLLHGGTRLGHEPITVEDVYERADQKLALAGGAVQATFQAGSHEYTKEDLLWLQGWISQQSESAQSEFNRPAPVPDQPPGGSWVWSTYSAEQLHRLVIHVLETAINGYTDLVARNFGDYGAVLDHMSVGALHIVGQLVTAPRDVQDLASAPILNYTITGLPDGTDEPIVDIALAVQGDPFRAEVSSMATSWSSTAALHTWGSQPATRWAYQWLIEDLAAVHWVKSVWQVPD